MVTKLEYEERKISQTPGKDTAGNYQWWQMEGTQLAGTVFNLVNQIYHNQFGFWRKNFIFAQLYENIDSMITTQYSPMFNSSFDISSSAQVFNSKLTFNVVRSCVDSVTAKIAKNKPRVKFITSGGDHNMQKRALNLTKFLDGVFYQADVYKQASLAFKDACIFGTGCLKVYTDPYTNQVKVDRIMVPVEIIVEMNNDARYGKPKQLHQRKVVSKSALMALYPDYVEQIKAAGTLPNVMNLTDDQVVVLESWHLPSSPKSKDGKKTICIENCTLEESEYTKDYYPFVFIHYSERIQGFFGYGLVEELAYLQFSINKTIRMITTAQEINSVPRWFVEAGSLLQKKGFYSAGIMEYKPGMNPPIASTAPAMSADIYGYLENLVNKSYQMSGVSQLAAASQKPPGLDSGIALQEYQDINTERFAIQGERYEQMFLQLGKITIDLCRDIYKDKKSLTINAKSENKKFIESIDWKDCDLESQNMLMDCWPVSQLPSTPAGKLSFITTLAQAGIIQHSQMLELMQMPDIEDFYSLSNASIERTLIDLDKIVEDDEMQTPDPHMDLATAKVIAQAYYLKSRNNGVEEEQLDKLREYINQIDLLLTPPAPPMPAGPLPPVPGAMPAPGEAMMPPVPPQAVPTKPPVSQILPNAPKK